MVELRRCQSPSPQAFPRPHDSHGRHLLKVLQGRGTQQQTGSERPGGQTPPAPHLWFQAPFWPFTDTTQPRSQGSFQPVAICLAFLPRICRLHEKSYCTSQPPPPREFAVVPPRCKGRPPAEQRHSRQSVPEKEGLPAVCGCGPPPPHAGSQRGLVRPWEGRRAVNNEAGWLIHESPRNTEHNGSKLCINKLWLRCMIIKVGAPVFHVIYCENNSCGEGSVVFRISRPSHPRGEAEVARLSADEDRRAGSRSPEGAFHFLGMVSEGLGLGAGPSCAGELFGASEEVRGVQDRVTALSLPAPPPGKESTCVLRSHPGHWPAELRPSCWTPPLTHPHCPSVCEPPTHSLIQRHHV